MSQTTRCVSISEGSASSTTLLGSPLISVVAARGLRAREKKGDKLAADRDDSRVFVQIIKKTGKNLSEIQLVLDIIVDKEVVNPGMLKRIGKAKNASLAAR